MRSSRRFGSPGEVLEYEFLDIQTDGVAAVARDPVANTKSQCPLFAIIILSNRRDRLSIAMTPSMASTPGFAGLYL